MASIKFLNKYIFPTRCIYSPEAEKNIGKIFVYEDDAGNKYRCTSVTNKVFWKSFYLWPDAKQIAKGDLKWTETIETPKYQ